MNETPLRAIAPFGFVTENVKVEVAPTATGLGAKALVIVGGSAWVHPVNTMSS